MKNVFKKCFTLISLSVICASVSFAEDLSTLERIKSTKVMKLGVVQGEPWYFKDPITGKWDGVGYRLGVKIAEDLGATVQPSETTYGNAPAAIQSKQADLVLVLDATEERKKAISFPEAPLLYYKQGILLREDLKIENWQDLNSSEYRIGTAMGSSVDRDLTQRLPEANIERYANTDETIAAFISGRIDGLAFFHPALVIAKSKIRMGNLVIPKPEISNPTSGGIRKEDTAFREYVNSEFIKMMEDGTVTAVFEEYLKTKGLNPKEIPGVMK
ncbi:transporter substrate-binding domain-containing protein [Rhodanobacter aciditrophus]|uniref:Transporter substrate-binding domain-containing protein n=1 Tax=Rhodanobacter aciditrophus TaxID=1623218 RepID=A0ABW4B129_9GAMM